MRAMPTVLAAVLCATIFSSLRAQTLSQLPRGSRVRILLADSSGGRDSSREVVGSIASVRDDTLYLTTSGSTTPRAVAVARVQAAYRSAGRSRGDAAGHGLIFGAIAGGMLGYAVGSDCTPDRFICFPRSETAMMGAGTGGALGLAIGLAIGRTEKWSAVSLQGVTVQPRGRGLALSMAF